MRILVLGHTGMLGNAVARYIRQLSAHEVVCGDGSRFPSTDFQSHIDRVKPDAVVNCIGAIPQKTPPEWVYTIVNIGLPQYLDTLGVPVMHPSTDCEFNGSLGEGSFYYRNAQRNAADAYGGSKARASEWIETSARNTKIIRTSIVGHEVSTRVSLLDWFLSQEGTVRGYTDHFWNGITTLEWARQCARLLERWDAMPRMVQLASPKVYSKHELVQLFAEVYGHEKDITPHSTGTVVNKALMSDYALPELSAQLEDLRSFYKMQ